MTSLKSIFQYILAAMVLFTVAACSDDDDNIVLGGDGPSGEVFVTGDVPSRLEVPALKAGNQLIAHWTNDYKGKVLNYCLEYDYDKYHSRWVAFRFDGTTAEKRVQRKSYDIKPQYPKDPELKRNYIEDDRSFNGHDHGHLCASHDRLYSRDGNDQTFYMTNMSPQKASFNQKYWTKFENHVQTLGRDRSFADTLYVVKGGTIADGQFSGRVANNRIVVPNYYFIALLKVKNNTYSSIGFWVSHTNYDAGQSDKKALREKAVSIKELERLTGIDFFHNLPDKIEEQVEKSYSLAAWGL